MLSRSARLLCLALIGTPVCAQQFGPQQLISTATDGARTIHAADLDGDGDQDVLTGSSNDDRIAWFPNVDSLGTMGALTVISLAAAKPIRVRASDLDGDGDMDVLSASNADDETAWYENTDGKGSFGPQQIITTTPKDPRSIFAADVDGDGDQDVLNASWQDDEVAWFANTNGLGSFGPKQVITTATDNAYAVRTSDVDGDGDLDVLSASYFDDELAWYENLNGLGGFGAQKLVTTAANGPVFIAAVDLDVDGDPDFLCASWVDNRITWSANTDGLGAFGPLTTISTTLDPYAVVAADLDGDGDPDVVSGSCGDHKVAWYENQLGQGTFGAQQVISSDHKCVRSVFTADLDGDGDPDVLAASETDDKVAWYQNQHVVPDLQASPAAISLASGGTQKFLLQPGSPHALKTYLLLGTLSGTAPGIPVDGFVLPLNPDGYFLFTLANPGSAALPTSLGALDGSGNGKAALHVPAGMNPAFAGIVAHHAFVLFDLTTGPGPFVDFVSNAVSLGLIP
jgi:hypothetical protein